MLEVLDDTFQINKICPYGACCLAGHTGYPFHVSLKCSSSYSLKRWPPLITSVRQGNKHKNHNTKHDPVFHRKCYKILQMGGYKQSSSGVLCLEHRMKEAHTWVKEVTRRTEAAVPVFLVSKGSSFRAHWLSNYLRFL